MNEKKKAWKPKNSFPKLRARSKRGGKEISVATVSIHIDRPFTVAESKAEAGKGVVAYQVITRDARRESPRKKALAREADLGLLGSVDYRKRKRGK